ncbi:MAG: hypothetical protein KDB92_06465, partial [Chitinophagaceae bacterium]|nr:hypothetical protein [Chitinophagaceae bacterium]
MIPSLRKKYNDAFLQKKYEAFIHELEAAHPGQLDFRVAETPVFIPKDFNDKILDACESIIDIITDPKYKGLTKNSIPGNFQVPNENEHTQFIAFDFGVCINADGEYEPQLIEMQGFPSLFAYEILLDDMYRKHFQIPENFSCYLNGLNRATYIEQLKKIILNNYPPENVVLLEIFPFQQKTRIDFFCTKEYLGIPIICLTEVIKEG